MAYTDTEVYLLNVPLDIEMNHTYYFESSTEQEEFFKGKVFRGFTNLTYQRKEGKIYLPVDLNTCDRVNYVMFRNPSYESNWFYAFIKNSTYINDDCVEITIEIDPIQTYMFRYTVGTCFIERQHVDDDRVGLNTIPEGLETGEYICNYYNKDATLESYVYLLLVTEDLAGSKISCNYGGVPAGYGALIYATYDNLAQAVSEYDTDGKGDAIIGAYMIPAKIVDYVVSDNNWYSDHDEPITYEYSVAKPTDLNGYYPSNKKLLSYPYQYLLLTNNAGTSNMLQFEHFSDGECIFEIQGIPTFGGSIKAIPINYKGMELNHEEGIMCGKFPTLSWSNDLYTNWLTQNAVNLGVGTASQLASVIGGVALIATGVGATAGAGMIAGGIFGTLKQMATVNQQSFTPASAKGNVNGGDLNTAAKTNTFHFKSMSIKSEYAIVIDRFFSMYGYKVNILDIPLSDHRENWWYTKTIDANITGQVPQEYLQKIINCYNKGITFWRSTANFRNYQTSNDII